VAWFHGSLQCKTRGETDGGQKVGFVYAPRFGIKYLELQLVKNLRLKYFAISFPPPTSTPPVANCKKRYHRRYVVSYDVIAD
jgi:hypothetical protein